MLVNHTAHTFWVGSSIVDLVVNCRGSALEETWTVRHRGIPRCATIPIPLAETTSFASQNASDSDIKRKAKEFLGLPPTAVIFLTVGAYFKYLPIDGLDS